MTCATCGTENAYSSGATKEASAKLKDELAPEFLKVIDRKLENNKKCLVGNNLTAADLAVYNALEIFLKSINPEGLGEYPRVKAHRMMVAKNENVKKWLDKRPDSAF